MVLIYYISNSKDIFKIYFEYIGIKIPYMPYLNKMSSKTREITIRESEGTFNLVKNKKTSKKDYNFDGISALRQLLNNEKARMIHVIKTKNPSSIYDLSKKLNRNFKLVMNDIKLLERFGFIELVKEKTKKRVRHKPEVVVDKLTISVSI